jgi:hypothetical protein
MQEADLGKPSDPFEWLHGLRDLEHDEGSKLSSR